MQHFRYRYSASGRLQYSRRLELGALKTGWLNSDKGTKCDMASSPNPFCTLRFVSLDYVQKNFLFGVTTPNVKNSTLSSVFHSFEAAKDRRGLNLPFGTRPVLCHV
jgi:hypothetical protein